ncbi:MAG: hypothetical protein JST62_01065 [Bacteroidetes bacterium]|nr:hypothetical protein [Bacteroidota bacterium]
MKNISSVLKALGVVTKYLGLVIILAETINFFTSRLKEKYPEVDNK